MTMDTLDMYDQGEPQALVMALLDGSASSMPLSDVLESAAYSMSDPHALMSAFGSRRAPADAETVFARVADMWAERGADNAYASIRAARDASISARRAATDRGLFRFMTPVDAQAVMSAAENGNTSALLSAKERYVFG